MSTTPSRRKATVPLGEAVARIIAPITARRGFTRTDLLAVWPEIAGPLHAACTQPEKIVWPRQREGEPPQAGMLVIRADGPRAVFLQHELPQIVERVNAFFGYCAVAQARIVQGPVGARPPAPPPAPLPTLDAATERRVADGLAGVEHEDLRRALHGLARGVFTERRE